MREPRLIIPLLILMTSCGRSPAIEEIELRITVTSPSEADVNAGFYLMRPCSMDRIDDIVYVADYERAEIQMLSIHGEPIGIFGSEGFGPGELNSVFSLRCRSDDRTILVLHHAGSRVDIFRMDGLYLSGFTCPVISQTLDILTRYEMAVLSPQPTPARGGVVLSSLSGDLVRDMSPPLDLQSDQISAQMQSAIAVVWNSEIWHIWIQFNHVRVFNINGELLREFHVRDELIEQMHRYNLDRVQEGRSPAWMVTFAGLFGDYLWLSVVVAPALPEEYWGRQYIFQVNREGEVIKRYYLLEKEYIRDIVVLEQENGLKAILMIINNPTLFWVEAIQ